MMVEKVQAALPQRIYSAVVPKSKAVRVALLVLAAYVVYRLVSSLLGRATSPRSDPQVDQLIKEGWQLMEEDNHPEALKRFQEAIALKPTNPNSQAHIRLGSAKLCLLQNPPQIDTALDLLNQVINQTVVAANLAGQALMVRGSIYEEKKQNEQALIDFKNALSCYLPQSNQTLLKLKILRLASETGQTAYYEIAKDPLSAPPEPSREVCEELIKVVEICRKEKQYNDALDYIQNIEQYLPDDNQLKADCLCRRARVHLDLGQFHNSLEDLRKALETAPLDKPVLKRFLFLLQAKAHLGKGDKPAAIQSFQEALKFAEKEKDHELILREIQKLQS